MHSDGLVIDTPLVTFTADKPVTLAVAVDNRRGRLPWRGSDWTDTATRVTDSESPARTFEVFAKSFPAGQIPLGPNADPANGSSMYLIAVT